MQRVIAYIDGFNLYFGMKEKSGNVISGSMFRLLPKIFSNPINASCTQNTSPVEFPVLLVIQTNLRGRILILKRFKH
jgi:hypothetical protein